jgi:hypothetical protein
MSRIASDASFGSSREHALPAAQRAALRRPRPGGPPRTSDDLVLHGPPGSDATMMKLIPMRGPHHHCACCGRDASGSSRLHRVHHRLPQRATPGRAPQLRGTRRTSASLIAPHARPGQPAALVAPDTSLPPGIDVCAAASSPVSHAARRRVDAPQTWPPRLAIADRRTPPDLDIAKAGQISTRDHQPGE